MKKLITGLTIALIMVLAYMAITFNQTVKANENKDNGLITEVFVVQNYNNSTGMYEAVNTRKGTDKAIVVFAAEDIEGNKNIQVNSIIRAFYAERTGEDEFIKVRKYE